MKRLGGLSPLCSCVPPVLLCPPCAPVSPLCSWRHLLGGLSPYAPVGTCGPAASAAQRLPHGILPPLLHASHTPLSPRQRVRCSLNPKPCVWGGLGRVQRVQCGGGGTAVLSGSQMLLRLACATCAECRGRQGAGCAHLRRTPEPRHQGPPPPLQPGHNPRNTLGTLEAHSRHTIAVPRGRDRIQRPHPQP